MSIVSRLKGKGASGFGYGSTAEDVTASMNLAGKTFLITGVNSGLGKETMRVLSLRGAGIVAVARTTDKAASAAADVGANVATVACDLSEPGSVRACVEAVKALGHPLDGIIANAGIMALPKLQVKHGLELQFLTNHIGHFMLVTGLVDALTDQGRVVMLSSGAHKMAPRGGILFDNLDGSKGYQGWKFYGQSKLANLLFARHLSTRLTGNRTANALHPGVINTNLGRHIGSLLDVGYAIAGPIGLKTIPQGAATQCYVATHPSLSEVTGEYFGDCNLLTSTRLGSTPALAAKLWAATEDIVSKL